MTALPTRIASSECDIDMREYRDTLGCFATGVAIVTTKGRDGVPVGLTVSSFNSVSMTPPLILWSLSLDSPSLAAFREHDAFAVNILSAEQDGIARHFATPRDNKFSGVDWRWAESGVPLVEGCSAALECRAYRRHEGGDHEIFLGEVTGLHKSHRPGLVFSRGDFCRTAPHS